MISIVVLSASAAIAQGVPYDCAPVPYAREDIKIVEPRGAAIGDPRGIWVELSAPFGQDIRGWMTFNASATATGPKSSARHLRVEGLYLLSGDAEPADGTARWLLHLESPQVASRVSLEYRVDLPRQTNTGQPCPGLPGGGTFHIGDFDWVPSNGTRLFPSRP